MKNRVEKKITKKKRKTSEQLVRRSLYPRKRYFVQVLFRSPVSKKSDGSRCVATLAKRTKAGEREERRKRVTKQGRAGWLICL